MLYAPNNADILPPTDTTKLSVRGYLARFAAYRPSARNEWSHFAVLRCRRCEANEARTKMTQLFGAPQRRGLGRDDISMHEMDVGPITFINVFEIESGQLESFLTGWRERAAFMSKQPGFRSFRLHRALSPDSHFQLVNVAEWESADALHAAMAQQTFTASVRRAVDELGVTAHPGVYRVAFEVTAPPTTKAHQTTVVAQVVQQGTYRVVAARVELWREGTCGADGARPQVGQAPLDAGHGDDRQRQALCGPRCTRLGLGRQCPCGGRGHASARAPHRTGPHGRGLPRRRPAAAAGLSNRSAGCRGVCEERRTGEARYPGGICGARRPLRGLPRRAARLTISTNGSSSATWPMAVKACSGAPSG